MIDPESARPEIAVILCHGFGAPGTDLVPLAGEMLMGNAEFRDQVVWVFPAAPLSLADQGMPGGRAWWQLDVNRLMSAIESGQIRNLRNDHPAGLEAARAHLEAVRAEVVTELNVPAERTVLGGFSQGAMLATDVTLHAAIPPAGLAIMSGTLLCEEQWTARLSSCRPVPVVQSHGRQDPILPFAAAEWLRDLLRDNGFPVEFIPFDGPHTIPREALQAVSQLIAQTLQGSGGS